ncbi:MAG: hypothetical protein NVSMB29_07370 [Candidatus Dormibacteria bacterium]
MTALRTPSRPAGMAPAPSLSAPPASSRPLPTGEGRRRAGWLLAGLGLALVLTVQGLRDPDVWWHLAVGQLIHTGGIPAREPFSFLPASRWAGQEWGFELLLDRVVAWGGAGLASLLMGLLGAGAFAVAVLAVPRGQRVAGPARAAALVISAAVAAQVLGVRPQVVTVLGFAVTLLLLTRWRDGRTASVWWLPPLVLVWVNLHAGVVAGLALIAAVLVASGGLRLARRDWSDAPLRPLAGALALSVAATLVNPAGPRLWPYILATLTSPTQRGGIVEWQSPDFHNPWLRLLEVSVFCLVALWMTGPRPDPLDLLLFGGGLVATLQAQRNVSLLAVLMAPLLARHGAAAWERHVSGRLRTRRRPAGLALAAGGLVFVLGLAASWSAHGPRAVTATEEKRAWPQLAAAYLADRHPAERVYSIYEWGGYLAYRLPRHRQIFLYGEAGVFGDRDLGRYLEIHLVGPHWQQELRDDGMRLAVVPDASQEASALREVGWHQLFHDGDAGAVVLAAP